MMKSISKPTAKLPVDVDKMLAAVFAAKRPELVRPIEDQLARAETIMRAAGLYGVDQIRQVNEARMWAAWRLGVLLAKVERVAGGTQISRADKIGFMAFIAALDPPLDKMVAQKYQRIATMPKGEMEKCIVTAHKAGEEVVLSGLLRAAMPWWYNLKRRNKHITIAAMANEQAKEAALGPFPLLYVDPPWKFETYTEENTHRMPDDHYPTLTDEEIIKVEFAGRTIDDLSADDAALFMWCTSSNIERALRVMRAWGFEYKTQAVWDKQKIGLGLIFRNQHEVLLYGSRGNPPKPIKLYPSVFRYARTKHSAKPPEIRQAIEKMYPFFSTPQTKVELFARGKMKGWTCVGFEAS